jgi:hypothetical protein
MLFEETQIRVRCFGTLDWWRGHEVWAFVFARKRVIFFCDGSLNQLTLKILIFYVFWLRRLILKIESIFCVSRLKQSTLKIDIFSINCLRQPQQK